MNWLATDRSRLEDRTKVPHSKAHRVLAAYVCLLAVGLLFAPYAGAAWMNHAMDCCTGDHCNIPEHHHRNAAPHADCDHDSGGLTACTMSCCQDEDQVFVAAMTFVMPDPTVAAVQAQSRAALDSPRSIEIPRSIQPLLPPPRAVSLNL
jgi:hypothetical protein